MSPLTITPSVTQGLTVVSPLTLPPPERTMSQFLTPEQRLSLVDAHCQRVVDNMEHDELIDYAKRMMAESFDQHPGCGDVDEARLLSDVYRAESEDLDSVAEFIAGAGIDTATIDNIVNNYQF